MTKSQLGTAAGLVTTGSGSDGFRIKIWDAGGVSSTTTRWAAECPSCDEAKNHGAYVSCSAEIVSEYVEAGLVDEEGSSCLINPVARTDCGKKGK